MAKRPTPPGIKNENVSSIPSEVKSVATAIPAFIGYTEKAEKAGVSLLLKPTRISSMANFNALFGGKCQIKDISVVVDEGNNFKVQEITIPNTQHYLMYDSLRLFFDNGGRDCFIVSVGFYGTAPAYGDETDAANIGLRNGVKALEAYDAPTLILFPDAVNVVNDGTDDPGFYGLQQMALQQCGKLQDRFCILDLKENITGDHAVAMQNFRNNSGTTNLKFGAAYSPFLINSYSFEPDLSSFMNSIYNSTGDPVSLQDLSNSSAETALIEAYIEETDEEFKKALQKRIYQGLSTIANIVNEVKSRVCTIPPSGGIAGIYALVDSISGVWKAPANVSLNSIMGVSVSITQEAQESMNVDTFGKSINAIRVFPGKGVMIWGARTLAGNDNEWRYVPVIRLFIMVRESCSKALKNFRNEPNDANTWLRLTGLIENYLTTLWKEGTLAGGKPNEAYFVNVGLGKTMTAQDILEGRLILEMGLAPMRPAEFIVIRLRQEMFQG